MPARALSLVGRLPFEGRRFTARQHEVLDSLELAFFQDGLDVTVGELAERARCSRRTLYELAPTKEELFLLMVDRMLSRAGRDAREAAAAERLPERRMEVFSAVLAVAFQPVSPPFMAAMRRYGPAGWLFDHHLSLARGFLVATIEEGIASGHFHRVHAELAAEALLAAVRRVSQPGVLEGIGMSASEAGEELFGLVVHGLVAAPGRRRSAGAAEPADHGSAG